VRAFSSLILKCSIGTWDPHGVGVACFLSATVRVF
jgi:hypothetical protein